MEVSKAPNRFPKTGVLNRVTGTGGARDATRGDLLSLGVTPPEDNSWRSMFNLGDRVGRAGDINTDASFS